MKRNMVLLLTGLMAACVTINIYFPAAAAQEVADEIINDVWQLKEGEEAKTPESKETVDTETTKSKSEE